MDVVAFETEGHYGNPGAAGWASGGHGLVWIRLQGDGGCVDIMPPTVKEHDGGEISQGREGTRAGETSGRVEGYVKWRSRGGREKRVKRRREGEWHLEETRTVEEGTRGGVEVRG
ncbi:hypothetical protein Pmani_038874 [Petrolisthes manimaculis]|uniref:Uncharacterized protein n=1 Tax=Petrolisthes manimaculis TaxID=1843537 RepID=A0AAE1NE40_9EUCA|nr:hypothetical protein Pmani_038874 [Petrolisthes manimaculis]